MDDLEIKQLSQVRGILKALRQLTDCPEGESILTHVTLYVRRHRVMWNDPVCRERFMQLRFPEQKIREEAERLTPIENHG